ncbi:hypothetical protein RFI_04267, partial [Reticulomyxa filosa]
KEKDLKLRVSVSSGGCSGFQYVFELINDQDIENDQDIIIHDININVDIVIDKQSLIFLKGSTLDYVQDLLQKSFVISNNPNVQSKCGCNVSFSPKDDVLRSP